MTSRQNNITDNQDILKEQRAALRNLSSTDFLNFGIDHFAYIKQVKIGENLVFAVHAADGRPIHVVENAAGAQTAIYENDLNAITLH